MALKRTLWHLASLPAALALVACIGGSGGPGGSGDDDGTGDDDDTINQPDAAPPPSEWEQQLAAREVNYPAAYRIATLRLAGRLPTMAEQKRLTGAADMKAEYEAMLDERLAAPEFTTQLRAFFRDSFRMGGQGLDTAPTFATQLVVEDQDFTKLFTATTNNCPTFANGAFAGATCASNAPAQVGVLTNQEVMKQFASNMAFRRVRWVQETFLCTKFPSEFGTPTDVGGAADYTGKFPFTSISGKSTNGRVDFQDAAAVVCANCHSTMNHQAPLFANFNDQGLYQNTIQVKLPIDGTPTARLDDWLPAGEGLAYKYGTPVTSLTDFGAAMAADPAVGECMVARTWNWALGKGDIVGALATVPAEVIAAQTDLFTTSKNLKQVIRSVFTSDDFVKF